jgi:hypothetical protein
VSGEAGLEPEYRCNDRPESEHRCWLLLIFAVDLRTEVCRVLTALLLRNEFLAYLQYTGRCVVRHRYIWIHALVGVVARILKGQMVVLAAASDPSSCRAARAIHGMHDLVAPVLSSHSLQEKQGPLSHLNLGAPILWLL